MNVQINQKNIMDLDVKITGRSVCIVCGRKKERIYMCKHGQHWTCKDCLSGGIAPSIRGERIKVLNLYAGIGGNRKLWPENVQVTAVELNPNVAAAYKNLYAHDNVIIGDAHAYLLKHFYDFDFVWSSPSCQSHSRMNYWMAKEKKRYPDLSLYEEIIFLKTFCKTKFVVENVNPYYTPLVAPDMQIGRHLFWSNFKINETYVPNIEGFIDMNLISDKERIENWLGISYHKNIYLTAKNPLQVYRNCVHPFIGLAIFNDAFALK